jgi:MFS family permease
MKVWPSFKKTLLLALVIFLFSAGIVFTSCINLFLFQEWDYRQWLIIGVFLVSSILILIFSLRTYFYVIEKRELVVVKFKRELVYPYSEIIYIDQNQKRKNSTITIVMKSGQTIYLIPDKGNQVYESFQKNCDHLLDKQEVINKFPRIKL